MDFSNDVDFNMDQMSLQPDPNYQHPPDSSNFESYFSSQQTSGPVTSGMEQAIMWQQGHYMGAESGYISAASTQPPSTTGHGEDFDGACYSGANSIYNLNSGQVSEVSSLHSSHMHMGLTDPEEFIPRLVEFLQDPDPVVVYEYLYFIERCLSRQSFFNALVRSFDLINAIVQTLNKSMSMMANMELQNSNNKDINEDEFQKQRDIFDASLKRILSASKILQSMTNKRENNGTLAIENQRIACQNILAAGGLTPLIGLLACRTETIKFKAIVTIHNFLLCLDEDVPSGVREGAMNAFRDANGVQVMVKLLHQENVKLLTILTESLRLVATENQSTKMIIIQSGGPTLLVNNLKKHHYKHLIVSTSKLLRMLSVCSPNKLAIIEAGGIEAVIGHLHSEDVTVQQYSCFVLRNLSDHPVLSTSIVNPDTLSMELTKLLHFARDKKAVLCAAEIIANLTVHEVFKDAVHKAGGIQGLLQVVESNVRYPNIQEEALCGLGRLVNVQKNKDIIHHSFIHGHAGLSKLSRCIHPEARRPSLKAALGVVRLLASNPNNLGVMRDEKILHILLGLLSVFVKNGMSNDPSQIKERAGWEQIIDLCLLCIFHFSKDQANQGIIRDRSILLCLKSLLAYDSEDILRLSAAILKNISIDNHGAFDVQSVGLEESVNALIHSKNVRIASHATSIMFNLAKMKDDLKKGAFRPAQPSQQQQQQQSSQMQQQPQQFQQHQTQQYQQNQPPPRYQQLPQQQHLPQQQQYFQHQQVQIPQQQKPHQQTMYMQQQQGLQPQPKQLQQQFYTHNNQQQHQQQLQPPKHQQWQQQHRDLHLQQQQQHQQQKQMQTQFQQQQYSQMNSVTSPSQQTVNKSFTSAQDSGNMITQWGYSVSSVGGNQQPQHPGAIPPPKNYVGLPPSKSNQNALDDFPEDLLMDIEDLLGST